MFFHLIYRLHLFSLGSGYMSPEYAVDGLFSVKSDVFSFGVLVMEILSGKKNRGFFHHDHHHNLLGHVSISKFIRFDLLSNLPDLFILLPSLYRLIKSIVS